MKKKQARMGKKTEQARAYTKELYQQKCSVLFEHVYESYPERDAGVYASGL
jgi:hypothetical protein